MKYDLNDLKRAIDQAEKDKSSTEVEIVNDVNGRLLVKYSTVTDTDSVVITIYPTDSHKYAEITKTKRL